MQNQLENILKNGENESVEFIFTSEDYLTISKVISSFANSNGGSVFFGVKKNGKITGIEPSECYSAISTAIEKYCFPPVDFDSNIHLFSHKIVLEITVSKSNTIHKIVDIDKTKTYFRYQNLSLEANSVISKFLDLSKQELVLDITAQHETVLSLIDINNEITFTQLVKKSNEKREKLEDILAQLLHMKKVKFELKNDAVVYCIKP